MNRWLPHVLLPRPGWFILHAAVIVLVFLLGYLREVFGEPHDNPTPHPLGSPRFLALEATLLH